MKERVINLLNLRISESKYVFDLLRIQFFIGIANAFINIVAFTYFIYDFSITGLPYAYLAIAGGLFLMNKGYQKLEHKLSPLHLLRFILLLSSALVFFFWTGLLVWDKHTLIFIFLVFSNLFYMVTGYAYWGLVSLVFNVRESKRVFSIVGSGDIPTKLIGYALAPLLIPVIGLQNILLLSLASLAAGFFFIEKLMKEKSWDAYKKKAGHHHHHQKHTESERKLWITLLFKNRLIFAISLLSILSYNVFNFIDYTFVAQVKQSYKDLAELAFFIALFFGVGRFLALILKLVFTSRLIEKLGIIACLLITPAVLFSFCLAFLLFPVSFEYSLYAFGAMAALTEVLRSIIQEPVFFVLFQPLNEHQRLEGHIIAKGYMLPPSLIIVGLSLIGLQEFGIQMTITLAIKILMANLAIWALMIFFVKREYITVLHSSISRGIFHGEHIKIHDNTTINILKAKIENGTESEVIYALKLLESAKYEEIDRILEQALDHAGKEVRKFALEGLHRRKQINKELLKNKLASEKEPEVKQKLISVLCKHDPDFLHQIFNHLSEQDHAVRKSVIIHLLNQKEFTYLFKAGKEIDRLIHSQLSADRALALEIISELDSIHFNDVLQQMFHDPNPAVKRGAITAACKLRCRDLLPSILDLMHQQQEHYLVMQGLMQYGDMLFEDIKSVDETKLEDLHEDLIKVAGRIKGGSSIQYLFDQLDKQSKHTDKIIHSLWSKALEVQTVAHIHRFQNLLYLYLKRGSEKIVYLAEIPQFRNQEMVKSSIETEIRNDLITSLKICALLFHKREINRILELVQHDERTRLYNAMEMLELVIPKKIATQINLLMDHVLDPAAKKKPVSSLAPAQFFQKIVVTKGDLFNAWTKAACIFCSLKNNEVEFISCLEERLQIGEHLIVRETMAYVKQTIQKHAYADH